MLETCLLSLRRHDAGEPNVVVVLAGDREAYAEACDVSSCFPVEVRLYDSTGARTSSGRHARMLDAALADSGSERFLTLDSDCFPVADGWLSALAALKKDVAGILWPWVPPPSPVEKSTIEWRLRRQHCWNNTQVACQLLSTAKAREMGLRFGDPDGDDNNFGLMDKAHAAGMSVGGLMPTMCVLPDDTSFDPEANRMVGVVYGGLVYHHGGASREKKGEMYVDSSLFGSARQKVLDMKGAEWVLEEGNHHAYRMDAEEEVAQFKMKMVYRDAITFLGKNSSLFGGGWV
jgi:hypothetical protein